MVVFIVCYVNSQGEPRIDGVYTSETDARARCCELMLVWENITPEVCMRRIEQ